MSVFKSRIGKLIVVSAVALAAVKSMADDAVIPAGAHEAVSPAEVASRYGLDADNVKEGPLGWLYEVVVGTNVRYVTKDGRYLIAGSIVDLDSKKNLTEQRLDEARAAMLKNVDPSVGIVFSPPDGNVKHTITVFTDVDCGYCREFHRGIGEVTSQGIAVRYLSWPRTGPNTDSWFKAENVWCAQDRHAAITDAKLGQPVPQVSGCNSNNIIQYDFDLGKSLGVDGTPSIYTDDGVKIGGYIPPDQILSAIENAGN